MKGSFVLYPVNLDNFLTKKTNVCVNAANSYGSELSQDVICQDDIPPYDVSLRDGWAIRTEDVFHSEILNPVVNGVGPEPFKEGSSRWINTGGYLPSGADAVVAEGHPEEVGFASDAYPLENVLPRGSEWRKGQIILKRGTVLGASEQALLFEAGIENISVWKRPSVAVLATGHEICEAGADHTAGRHSSNSVYLINLLNGMGLTDTAIFYAKDEVNSIADRLELLSAYYDFVVTIGGTGQGKSDVLRNALRKVGAEQDDDETKLASSLPFICSRVKNAAIFGLPGNPLGFVNIVQRVVIPTVWQSFRSGNFPFERKKVYMGFDYEGKAGDICVQLAEFEAKTIALPVQKGSGRSSAFRDASAIIANPSGLKLSAGSAVEALLFFDGILS